MHVWNVLSAARWKCRTQESAKKLPSGHHRTTVLGYIFATKACTDSREKNLLNSNISFTCLHNMVNFSPLAVGICWRVWGTPANFNGFCVLAALLHGTLVVDVSQTLWRWTEGDAYIRRGGHHVWHWPTFLVSKSLLLSTGIAYSRARWMFWAASVCSFVCPYDNFQTIKRRTMELG